MRSPGTSSTDERHWVGQSGLLLTKEEKSRYRKVPGSTSNQCAGGGGDATVVSDTL